MGLSWGVIVTRSTPAPSQATDLERVQQDVHDGPPQPAQEVQRKRRDDDVQRPAPEDGVQKRGWAADATGGFG